MMKGLLLSFVCLVVLLCVYSNAITVEDQLATTFPTYLKNVKAEVNQVAYNAIHTATQASPVTVFAYTEDPVASNYSYLVVPGSHQFSKLYDPLTLNTLYNLSTPPTTNNRQVLAFTLYNNTGVASLYVNDYVADQGLPVSPTDFPCDNGVIIKLLVDTAPLNPPSNTIAEQLASTAGGKWTFNNLRALINHAGVNIPFNITKTLFAPSDDVFQTIYANNPILQDYLTSTVDLANTISNIQSILETHIIDDAVYPTDVPNNGTSINVTNEAGTILTLTSAYPLNVTDSRGTTAHVTQPNILANDGVIHAINQVFFPSTFTFTLRELLLTANVTQFINAISNRSLDAYLAETDIYTIFVPVDSAFSGDYPSSADLLYHFVPQTGLEFNSEAVYSISNSTVAGFGNQRLFLTQYNNSKIVNNRRVINQVPYSTSKNTQVYLIDSAITLPVEVKNSLPSGYSTFSNLLQESRFIDKYFNVNQANITVFAPSDDAIDKLYPGVVGYWSLNTTEAISNVITVINNHILLPSDPKTPVYAFPEGTNKYMNANHADLTVDQSHNRTTINTNVKVINGPIITLSGTAFGIDSVLLPTGYGLTAAQTLEGFSGYDRKNNSYGTYETFLRLMQNIEGGQQLLENEDVTIFAPTDDAFLNTEENLDSYGNHSAILQTILLNHVALYDNGLGLNRTGEMFPVGGNSSHVPNFITVLSDEPGKQAVIELEKAGVKSGTANVIMETRAHRSAIYGIDRVLGVNQKNSSSGGSGLKTWQIILIAVGGGLLGLLLLAVLIGAVYYLVLRPKSGYRKIN